jgi:hypothetical protein
MVNKKLREVNDVLEYAERLKGELSESGESPSLKLMEKARKRMISAYTKMKRISE